VVLDTKNNQKLLKTTENYHIPWHTLCHAVYCIAPYHENHTCQPLTC